MSDLSFEEIAQQVVSLFRGDSPLPLMPFSVLFPDQVEWPEYILGLPEDLPPAVAGKSFKLFDLHCQIPSCDCQKVSLAFVDEEGKAWATVSYGWRSAKFYRQWGLNADDTKALRAGFLDPLAEQSEWNSYFLFYFQEVFKKDPRFIKYLKERYAYVKENLPAPFEGSDAAPQSHLAPVLPFKEAASSK